MNTNYVLKVYQRIGVCVRVLLYCNMHTNTFGTTVIIEQH